MNKLFKVITILFPMLLSSCEISLFGESENSSSASSSESISNSTSDSSTSETTETTETTSSDSDTNSSSSDSSDEPDIPYTINDFNSTEQIDRYKANGYTNLYQDCNFKDGFRVTKCFYGNGESPYHDKTLRLYSGLKSPTWTIAQWSSQYDIMEKGGYTITSSDYGLVNTITSKGQGTGDGFIPAKKLTLDSKTGGVYLECNTSIEYKNPRNGDDPWVHLLLSQDFDNNMVNVSGLESLVLEADYEIDYCENHTGSAYDTNKHAAQLVWYITIQNRNTSSPGYGKYIWFGIPLWDNRSAGKACDMYRAHDAGTDTLIYSLASADVFVNKKIPNIGVRTTAKVDIIDIVRDVYNYSQANGYLSNTEFEDLYIGGTNFGYEIPGTFNIGSTIHAINVFYKKQSIDNYNSTELMDKYTGLGYQSLFKDQNFKNGFQMTKCTYGAGESPYYDNYYTRFYSSLNKPDWRICQWNSHYDFYTNNKANVIEDNFYTHTIISGGLTNKPSKTMTFNSKTGSIYMETDGSVEYFTSGDRVNGDWPALLLEQDFSNNLKQVKKMSSLIMECEYCVNTCVNYTKSSNYDSDRHAAQLVWYVTIQNRNTSSAGYGEYVWFGLMLYDDRYDNKTTSLYSNLDAGTGTLIYNPSSTYYLKSGKIPSVGQTVTASVDVLSLFPSAFNNAKSKGYFKNTTYEDLYVGGFNFGFEIPGTFKIGTTINSIGLFCK